MAVKNVIIGSEEPKKKDGRGRPSKAVVEAKENAKIQEKIVKQKSNPAMEWFDGIDNEGKNIDILLSGAKMSYNDCTIQMTNTKKHGKMDDGSFDVFDEKVKHTNQDYYTSAKYEQPHFVVSKIVKSKKIVLFDKPSDFGEGFIKMCDFLNGYCK